jgi:hypothetical protein
MFEIGWQDAEATIVDRRLVEKSTQPDMGEFAGQGVEVYEYIADVRPSDGSAPFRATMKEPFNAITFKAPAVGEVVRVKYNNKHHAEHKVKFDRADPATYQNVPGIPDWRRHGNPLKERDQKLVADAHSPDAQAAWDAKLNAVPGTPSQSPSGSASSSDLVDAALSGLQHGDRTAHEHLIAELAAGRVSFGSGNPGSIGESEADPLDRIQKLADLRDRGAITDAEFETEKAKILGEG